MRVMGIFPAISIEKTRTFFFGSSASLSFQDVLIMYTSIIIALAGLSSAIFNYIQNLPEEITIFSVCMFIVFSIFFIIGRFRRISKMLYLLVSIAILLSLNFAWLYNFGSKGPILTLYLVAFTFYIFVWDKKRVVFIFSLILINLLFLYTQEIQQPNLVGSYPSEYSRISDVYFGLIFALMMMTAFIAAIKRNYIEQYQKARKADQLKSAFLANMSHEIRTPLNAIVGFSSLLAEEEFTKEKQELFKDILTTNSDYLLKLIEDIIDLSKIEVDELVFKNKEVNIEKMFEWLKISFEGMINKEQLSIQYELNLDNPNVYTDSTRLEQVLRNLINNAIKFTEKGSVTYGCIKEAGELMFFVKDTGIGIRPENQKQIFERFVKIEESADRLSRGTGIGLFLSKQLVEKMGGQIWVDSVFGEGTTFYFTICESNVTKMAFLN